ncbi:complement factor H-like isoform X2 [Poecilia latipinna]|uniref:complement factor H-like isoform X2 n=1 Tax=Poecilia latipinna TaxID=48699 RepID=UPI00072E4BEF|nr:PREDICTED: complement factor H-like isoform X2 [Poecilia latipinna]
MKVFLDTGRQRKLLILYLFIWNIAADCPLPEHGEYTVLTNESLLINDFPDGTVITYECRLGHVKTSGTGTSNCVNGKWTEPDIICRTYCPMPEGGKNMVLTDESLLRKDFPDGTKLTYKCNNGYEKESGSEIITCIGGNWTEPDLICKAYCRIPKGGENLVLTDESLLKEHFPDGTEVIYKCSNGFEKERGSENITCIDGNWTEPDLICKKQSIVETI